MIVLPLGGPWGPFCYSSAPARFVFVFVFLFLPRCAYVCVHGMRMYACMVCVHDMRAGERTAGDGEAT